MAEWVGRISLIFLVAAVFSGCSFGLFSSPNLKPGRVEIHTVRPGETLSQIGSQYGVSWQTIAALNKLSNPNVLEVGQRLIIARSTKKVSSSAVRPVSYDHSNAYRFKNGLILWPVPESGRVVSRFGPRHGGFHDGLDIAAPSGVPVVAAHDARVIYSDNELTGYGNLVILRTEDGLTTIYGHNSRLLVKKGQKVKRGERIALVGETGRAAGPHLHFEVRMRDKRNRYVAIDPMPLFESRTPQPRYRVNESLTPILARLGEWR